MNENIKIAFLKSAVFGYALMEKINDKNKNGFWAKLKVLDSFYFENKMFSPYSCAILILAYLMHDKNDLELKNRFSHLNIKESIDELEKHFEGQDIYKSHNKFITKIL